VLDCVERKGRVSLQAAGLQMAAIRNRRRLVLQEPPRATTCLCFPSAGSLGACGEGSGARAQFDVAAGHGDMKSFVGHHVLRELIVSQRFPSAVIGDF
jgi:hypothetical protein